LILNFSDSTLGSPVDAGREAFFGKEGNLSGGVGLGSLLESKSLLEFLLGGVSELVDANS